MERYTVSLRFIAGVFALVPAFATIWLAYLKFWTLPVWHWWQQVYASVF